ncbi:uncharacterized protein [Paramisgurnus dabryanus]|uniref:uncharacterized protein n=1 Tax=Paramisgurnus dabryanus TaxID=90735 RepID=UPI003CCF1853
MEPNLPAASQKTSPPPDPVTLAQLTGELSSQAHILAAHQQQLARLTSLTGELVRSVQSLAVSANTTATPAPTPPTPQPIAPPQASATPRLAFPEKFDGTPDKCKGFLKQCELFIAQQPNIYNTEVAGGRDPGEQLLNLRQGRRTAAEYALTFRTLAAQTNWVEDTLKILFRQGLNQDLQSELACCNEGMSFEEFVAMSIRVDNLVRSRRPVRGYDIPAASSSEVCEPMQVGRARLTLEEREHRFHERLCLYCGEAGHILAVCPTRPSQTRLGRVSASIPSTTFDCMKVPVTLIWQHSTIPSKALLDSGAAGNFIDSGLVKSHGISVIPCVPPLSVAALDGRPLGSGRITHITQSITLATETDHTEEITFYVILSPHNPIILGFPWLHLHNPLISWKEKRILNWNNECLTTCLNNPPEIPVCTSQINPVTSLPDHVPLEYLDLAIAFSKTKATQLPPHRPSDCAIELLPNTVPPRGRIFPLSEPEQQAIKKYIEEELEKGFIRHSTSPAAAGFFFVGKKDVGLRPCIDYRGLNDITVKFHYPLPLVPAALEQLRSAKIYSKLDLRNAYNLIRIREGEAWKTAFSTSDGHYEYLVMPFGLSNSPSVFQSFINDVFRDMLNRFVIGTEAKHPGTIQEELTALPKYPRWGSRAGQDVFCPKRASQLLPHRSWDCVIYFLSGDPVSKGKIYSLNIPEQEEKSETSLLHMFTIKMCPIMVTLRIGVIFFCQVLLCGFAESPCTPGFDSELFVFKVRRKHLHKETRVGEVIFNACDERSRTLFQSGYKRFSVRTDGSVTLETPVTLHDGYMMFDVHAWDSSGMKHTASVRVECTADHHEDHHMNISTPQMDTFPDDFVMRFPRSLAGAGPDGGVRAGAGAAAAGGGVRAGAGGGARAGAGGSWLSAFEEPAVVRVIIKVIDKNDNKPQFTQNHFNGNVPEAATKDYDFMTVTATDADDPNTPHAEVRYKIISQDPPSPNPNMFAINAVTGGIRVNSEGLNREKWSKYTLTIQAADMKGEGHATTGKAVIIVTDSNDNPPQFDQDTYTVSVLENLVGIEVAKLTVTDGDEPESPAWSTKYKIISGDEGVFNISTGPSQLEGIITTVKPLDYEKTKQYILSVIVENDDPFVGSLPTSTATVTVNVEDVNEPPVFNPKEKYITKPEDVPVGSDLVAFTATDPDIGRSQKLTYRISSDPAGFLSVVEDTGMIKIKSLMDRESNEVKDGKYKAIILAVDNDAEARATGTGTLIIELEDVNDNAPYINEREIKICNQEAPPVLLSITDKDLHPNAAPFSVDTYGDTMKNWTAKMNDSATGIELMLKSALEPGVYNVVLRVFDKQKLIQDSSIEATVCDCKGESVVCSETGAAGLLLPVVIRIICTIFGLLSISYLLVLFIRQQICLGQGGV